MSKPTKRPKLATLQPRVELADLSIGRAPASASGSYSSLYTHRRWRRIRQQQLLAHPLCAFCERAGKVVAATVVDHIEPHRGDMHAFWRGARQSLCKPCHDREKQRQEKAGGVGAS